jgi:tRNA ligase
VVRAALKAGSLDKQPHPNDLTEENWQDERRVFMWKIKFDQPYLMWREWREITKKILTSKKKAGDDVAEKGRKVLESQGKGKQRAVEIDEIHQSVGELRIDEREDGDDLDAGHRAAAEAASTSSEKSKKKSQKGKQAQASIDASTPESAELPSDIRADRIRNPETRMYVVWLERYMSSHPEAFSEYMNNRGIVAVREAFLEWRQTEEAKALEKSVLGKDAGSAQGQKEDIQKNGEPFAKTLIVPVAVPGCGRSSSTQRVVLLLISAMQARLLSEWLLHTSLASHIPNQTTSRRRRQQSILKRM